MMIEKIEMGNTSIGSLEDVDAAVVDGGLVDVALCRDGDLPEGV